MNPLMDVATSHYLRPRCTQELFDTGGAHGVACVCRIGASPDDPAGTSGPPRHSDWGRLPGSEIRGRGNPD